MVCHLPTNSEGRLGSDNMPISILVLTYNSASYITKLLDSIFDLLGEDIKKGEVEVIIFDNASTDKTASLVKGYSDKISFHVSDQNLGYAKGINEASKHSKGDLLIVVNPDATLLEFSKEKIVEEFENDKKLAIAGLNIENFNNEKEKNAGKFFNRFTFLLFALGFEGLIGLRFSPDRKRSVDFVSGGFVAIRSEFFKKAGGYDEDYFMYVEDMDICLRAKKMGYEVKFLPYATIVHKGQGSSNKEFAIVNIYKGLLTFYSKHKPKELGYIRSLLLVKAKLIIFLAAVLEKKSLSETYKKAYQAIV